MTLSRSLNENDMAADVYEKAVKAHTSAEWREGAECMKSGARPSYLESPLSYERRAHLAGLAAVVAWARSNVVQT